MQGVPGVLSINSFSSALRQYNEGYNEGNPKMGAVPIDGGNYAALAVEIARSPGLMRKDCSMTAVHLFLSDHKATTIEGVVSAVKAFRQREQLPGVAIRLASGNAGRGGAGGNGSEGGAGGAGGAGACAGGRGGYGAGGSGGSGGLGGNSAAVAYRGAEPTLRDVRLTIGTAGEGGAAGAPGGGVGSATGAAGVAGTAGVARELLSL